ncbi:MAG: hypothetical protein EA376_07545 [Phycisphaeraceae bacterium]|nr:MAG: hypothetical protein EA376_07545 [Phycisphaeraceae bacterium]
MRSVSSRGDRNGEGFERILLGGTGPAAGVGVADGGVRVQETLISARFEAVCLDGDPEQDTIESLCTRFGSAQRGLRERLRRPEVAPRAALAEHILELTAMESRDEDDEAGSH